MRSIKQTIEDKGTNILNVYFTAGHPTLVSTMSIIKCLSANEVDIIELGMPYSDPLADGPTIQKSSEIALKNGQTISNIFKDVTIVRNEGITTPIILMGYYNQMLQYGVEKFLHDSSKAGIQGLIIPDLPMDIYESDYMHLFQEHNLEISFLVTPLTSDERIHRADKLSSAFVYIVSQSSITGKQGEISEKQEAYFDRIKNLKLKSPTLIGFGIHNKKTCELAHKYAHGAIIGSAFIRVLEMEGDVDNNITVFLTSLK